MADIFMSYKRGADELQIEAIVGGLRANGYTVWWDRDIPAGAPWEETILAELHGARLAIVCWSKDAVDSENVRSEARYAKEHDKLLQIFVAPCQPPLFFGENQGLKVEDVAEVYGPRFEAVLAAVRERLGAVAAPAGKKRIDPAMRAWRRNEPRAPWEPLQFGLSYSVLCAALLIGLLRQGTDPNRLLDLSRFVGFTAIAAFLSAWLAYALIVRQPRRIGLFRGTLLALTAAVVGASCVLVYDAVARAFIASFEYATPAARDSAASSFEILPGMGPQQIGILTILAFLSGLLIARLWLPVFVQTARPLLRSIWPRLGTVALALTAPAFMLWAPFAPGRDTTDQRREEHKFVWVVAERGLETPAEARARADDPLGRASPEMISRIMKRLGFPDSKDWKDLSTAAFALEEGSGKTEPKTEWVLAADGSGDATTMQELLSRSAGKITIRVRPGLYRAEPDWSNPGPDARAAPTPLEFRNKWRDDVTKPLDFDEPVGPLFAAARAMAYSKTHILTLVGEPGAIFEETEGVAVPPGMGIGGLTLRFRKPNARAAGSAYALLMGYPSNLIAVRVEIATGAAIHGIELEADKRASTDIANQELDPTRIEDVTVSSPADSLLSGIRVRHGAVARIVGSRIEGVSAELPCITIHATRDVTVRDTDLRACAPLKAIRAPAPNANLILDNLGARATPVLYRGEAEDFYRY